MNTFSQFEILCDKNIYEIRTILRVLQLGLPNKNKLLTTHQIDTELKNYTDEFYLPRSKFYTSHCLLKPLSPHSSCITRNNSCPCDHVSHCSPIKILYQAKILSTNNPRGKYYSYISLGLCKIQSVVELHCVDGDYKLKLSQYNRN